MAADVKTLSTPFKWINCELKKGTKTIVNAQLKDKGHWGYAMGSNRPVRRRRRGDPLEDAMFQPGTNKFWIRLACPIEGKAVVVWVWENNSPGKEHYQKKCGDFLVRQIMFKVYNTLKEAEEAGSPSYPAHWKLHQFAISWGPGAGG